MSAIKEDILKQNIVLALFLKFSVFGRKHYIVEFLTKTSFLTKLERR